MIEPDDVSGADAEATADRLRREANRLRDRAALLDHAADYLAAAGKGTDPPQPRFVTAEDLFEH